MVLDPAAHDLLAIVFVIVAARVAAGAPLVVGLAVAALAIALPLVLAAAGVSVSSANLIVGTAFAWFAGYEVRSQQHLMHALVDAQIKLDEQAATAERQHIGNTCGHRYPRSAVGGLDNALVGAPLLVWSVHLGQLSSYTI
jgi:hypothetical protein